MVEFEFVEFVELVEFVLLVELVLLVVMVVIVVLVEFIELVVLVEFVEIVVLVELGEILMKRSIVVIFLRLILCSVVSSVEFVVLSKVWPSHSLVGKFVWSALSLPCIIVELAVSCKVSICDCVSFAIG